MDQPTVVVAADSNFHMQLAVVVAGVAEHVPDARVFLLHDGYDEDLQALVAPPAAPLEIEWIDARSAVLDGAILSHYPPATLYRLRMEELLPPQIDRVLYLDADVAVTGVLEPLWDEDLAGAALGAVRDPLVPWAGAPRGLDWRALGMAPSTPYFNAGVVLASLDRWRETELSRRALDVLGEHHLPYADQCALNVVLGGAWTPLDPRWNLQAAHINDDGSLAWITEGVERLEAARTAPAVVHFNTDPFGWGRPWRTGCTHPRRELWYRALDRTSWRGWRPAPPAAPPNLLRRRLGRAKRQLTRRR
jgi:lipopolysaccharide biosynthesis glycosyltransferase